MQVGMSLLVFFLFASAMASPTSNSQMMNDGNSQNETNPAPHASFFRRIGDFFSTATSALKNETAKITTFFNNLPRDISEKLHSIGDSVNSARKQLAADAEQKVSVLSGEARTVGEQLVSTLRNDTLNSAEVVATVDQLVSSATASLRADLQPLGDQIKRGLAAVSSSN